jgi:hypothetical protein
MRRVSRVGRTYFLIVLPVDPIAKWVIYFDSDPKVAARYSSESDLHCWLRQRRSWFLGVRHFLSDQTIELLRIERLFLEEFSRDFLQLIAMRRQYLLGVAIGMVEKNFNLLINISRRRLTAVALHLAVQESRLALDAADQSDAFTHPVGCHHLACQSGSAFQVVLSAGGYLAKN